MNDILQNLFQLQTLDFQGKKSDLAQAAGLRASIPQGMLTNYDRARARGKKGITLLRNNVCTNCRMQVPVAVTASLMRGAVEVCGNCGLYLCLPEPEDMPLPKPAPTRVKSGRAKKDLV